MKKVTKDDVKVLLDMTEEGIIDSVGRAEDVLMRWAKQFYKDEDLVLPATLSDLSGWINIRWRNVGFDKWHEELANLFNYNEHVNDGFWANYDYMAEANANVDRINGTLESVTTFEQFKLWVDRMCSEFPDHRVRIEQIASDCLKWEKEQSAVACGIELIYEEVGIE